MNGARLELSEKERVSLGIVVAMINREMACLSRPETAANHRQATKNLVVSWAQMVELLASLARSRRAN